VCLSEALVPEKQLELEHTPQDTRIAHMQSTTSTYQAAAVLQETRAREPVAQTDSSEPDCGLQSGALSAGREAASSAMVSSTWEHHSKAAGSGDAAAARAEVLVEEGGGGGGGVTLCGGACWV
jgi:hypothetical protein